MAGGGGKQSQSGSQTSKGTGTSTTTSPFAGTLATDAQNLIQMATESILPGTTDLNTQWQKQLSDILAGKYTGATIPLIQNATSAARQATAGSLADTQANLAKTGAANSPFAATALSGTSQAGREAVAQAPTQVAEQTLGQVPGAVSTGFGAGNQQAGIGVGGLADAMRGALQTITSYFGSGSSDASGKGAGITGALPGTIGANSASALSF